MNSQPFIAGAIANRLLDIADLLDVPLSHLSLQKLLFLIHGLYLCRNGSPLIKEHFEAWQYGPVLPSVYRCFKGSGSNALKDRVKIRNLMSDEEVVIESVRASDVDEIITSVLMSYGRKSPSFLVDLTHAKHGPWQLTLDKSRTLGSLGLKIANDTILQSFRNLKVTIREGSTHDTFEANFENAPFAEYRRG